MCNIIFLKHAAKLESNNGQERRLNLEINNLSSKYFSSESGDKNLILWVFKKKMSEEWQKKRPNKLSFHKW